MNKMAKNTLKKLERKESTIPSSDDPREELRRLVLQHKALTKAAVAIDNMSRDKKNRETGEVMKCRLPEDAMVVLQDASTDATKRAAKLKPKMLRELRKIPIYDQWLKHVFGIGDGGSVIAAYLVAEIDIHRCIKPSGLRRFCGMAVIDGRLERPTKGQKNAFSKEMRMRLFQMFSTLWKARAVKSKERPNGTTSKYLEIWENYMNGAWQTGRITDLGSDKLGKPTGKIMTGAGKEVSARGFVFSTGWHKAADVFLNDLYTVWRALEGLPCWPTYSEWVTGYKHGGTPTYQLPRGLNMPRDLTPAEAIAEVGYIGPIARTVPAVATDEDLPTDGLDGEDLDTLESNDNGDLLAAE
jgi:hypothetical protein